MPKPLQFGPYSLCRRTGKVICSRLAARMAWLWLVLVGLAALIWHLVRVLPKPSRAAYPCQRVAGPIAWSFAGSLLAWLSAWTVFRKGLSVLRARRYLAAALLLLAGGIAVSLGLVLSSDDARAMAPPDARNAPIGTARGLFPGRVVWTYQPAATPWNGTSGYWWDDNGTDQDEVDAMMAQNLRALTGTTDAAAAWETLFRSFNQSRGRGDVGYQAGEIIAIKINLNNQNSSYGQADNQLDASPHMVLALLRQLVNRAGVPQDRIVVYDAVRLIPDKIFIKCRAEFPQVWFVDRLGTNGRTAVQWTSPVIAYATDTWPDGSPCGTRIPQSVYSASYIINMALLKCHGTAGVTLTAKNHYGTIHGWEHWYIKARKRTMPLYNPLVDLMGHEDIGGKTMLFLIDALFGTDEVSGHPKRFQRPPFNNRWSSSLFASQDPVAIDSVGLDFLASEFPSSYLNNADNFLHEAALAHQPPSGTVYDPEGDGTRLNSLGTHEHWNNNDMRQYSRNLGSGNGIELVQPPSITPASRVHAASVATGQTVSVIANVPWTATADAAWITITDGHSGSGNGTVTYRVDANAGSVRSGAIVISGGGFTNPFIVQQSLPIEMSPAGGGEITDRRPAFSWTATPGATWYHLWINRNGQTHLAHWVDGVNMWRSPTNGLPGGSYQWWVRPWGPSIGYWPWSPMAGFSLPVSTPDVLAQIAPLGKQPDDDLTYRWWKDAHASWYRLWAGRVGAGAWHDRWFDRTGTGEAAVHPGGVCPGPAKPVQTAPAGAAGTNRPAFEWAGGQCEWWLRAWGPDGYGPWTGPMAFSIPHPSSTWYRVVVLQDSSMVIDEWEQGTSLPAPVTLAPGAHSWWLGVWDPQPRRTIWSDRMDFTVP